MLLYNTMKLYYRLMNNVQENVINLRNQFEKNIQSKQPTKLDPKDIPKYVNQLMKPPVYKPCVSKKCCPSIKHKKEHSYTIDISEFKQQILPPGLPPTKVWGYGGLIKDEKTGKTKYSRSAPGATFEAIRSIPVKVKWINHLKRKHLFAVNIE